MRTGQSFIQQFYRANIAIGSTGVLASLCTPSKTRQFGFEVAADFYQANSDPRYANDHTIRLIIVEPALTYRVFTDPAYDILDVGGGLGAYFFSSLGFQSFNGLVTQIRADIHGPTRWINSGDLAAALSLLTFRVGSTRFPAGFKEGVFGPGSKAIPAEWTPTYALFFDITPFFRRPRDMFGIR
jgi:hypothetical protein